MPFAAKGTEKGPHGYHLISLVKKNSPYQKLSDLKGKRVAHTSPSSNSGHLAPLVLYPPEGLKPNEDYKPLMSGGHDKSSLGVASGDYDMAGVASDVFDRMVTRGTLKADDFRIIFISPVFPTSSFAYAHDLHPELARKVRACFFAFDFPPSMRKEFNNDDRFFPITYKDTWKVVREIAESSGTPYNKAAFDAEARREAEALAKKQQQLQIRISRCRSSKTTEAEIMDASTGVKLPPAPEVDRSLVIRNLRKEYRAGEPVLRDVSVTVEGRGLTAIIGPSGTGKSTLVRCINRLVDPTAGEILFRGQDLARLYGRQLRAARRRIGMVFQEYNLVERLSVIENVLCGRLGYVAVWRAWLRKFPPQDVDRAFHLLDAVGLGDFATQRADQLSGGQRQRVGIARALMQEPDLVLADEPTSSLDPKTSVEIMELIARRAGERDIPVIVNIHNVELARRFADRIIGLAQGEIVFDGAPGALEERQLLQIYGGEGWLE